MHKFSPKIKKQIKERDGYVCVVCGSPMICPDPHHVYWHTFERIYDGTENNEDKGVCLCFPCHRSIHDGDKQRELVTKRYLYNFYKNSCNLSDIDI